MELFSIRRWTTRSAQLSYINRMLPLMYCITLGGGLVMNAKAYHLGQYNIHLLLLTNSMPRYKIEGKKITGVNSTFPELKAREKTYF